MNVPKTCFTIQAMFLLIIPEHWYGLVSISQPGIKMEVMYWVWTYTVICVQLS